MIKKIERKFDNMSEDILYGKAKTIVGEKMKEKLEPFNPKIEWNDSKKQGDFNVKGVLGTINVKGDLLTVIIDKIPMMLKPFKGKIIESIEKIVSKVE